MLKRGVLRPGGRGSLLETVVLLLLLAAALNGGNSSARALNTQSQELFVGWQGESYKPASEEEVRGKGIRSNLLQQCAAECICHLFKAAFSCPIEMHRSCSDLILQLVTLINASCPAGTACRKEEVVRIKSSADVLRASCCAVCLSCLTWKLFITEEKHCWLLLSSPELLHTL